MALGRRDINGNHDLSLLIYSHFCGERRGHSQEDRSYIQLETKADTACLGRTQVRKSSEISRQCLLGLFEASFALHT